MGDDYLQLHSLMADHGDCLILEYGQITKPKRILIDAGTIGAFDRLKPILDELIQEKIDPFELFVITHIDADHIGGALKVLEHPNYQKLFKEIWFNGSEHLNPGAFLEIFGAVQGELLTQLILASGVSWNGKFEMSNISLDEVDQPRLITIDVDLKITILSPGFSQLQKLLPKWDDEIKKAGLNPQDPNIALPQPASIFERLGSLDIDLLSSIDFKEDTSEANGSSIAMLVELNGKKILFGADAHPTVLTSAISKLNNGKPYQVDLFKLPHHGSKNNVSIELIKQIPSKAYLFSSNGAYYKHPDEEAVARVIKYAPPNPKLLFNCETVFNSKWNNPNLMSEWNYTVLYGKDNLGIITRI